MSNKIYVYKGHYLKKDTSLNAFVSSTNCLFWEKPTEIEFENWVNTFIEEETNAEKINKLWNKAFRKLEKNHLYVIKQDIYLSRGAHIRFWPHLIKKFIKRMHKRNYVFRKVMD